MKKARVYVGTYRKYNEGSLSGGWISIAECKDYQDFLARCKQLHKNEHDPEYMIQDTEDFPDGLGCMEWISEKDFNDVKAALKDEESPVIRIVDYSEKCFAVVGDTYPVRKQLKELGAWKYNKFLSCGAGWLFNNDKRAAVEAFINGVDVVSTKTEKTQGKQYLECLQEYIDTYCQDDWNKDYVKKENVGAISINGYYMLIRKPSIENRFCFHDEGPDYDFYCDLCKSEDLLRTYFLNKNERCFSSAIENIEKGNDVYVLGNDNNHELSVDTENDPWYRRNEKTRKATDEEKNLILEAYKFGLEKLHKRLETYLNRYGVSKIHTWTYWADA